MKTNQIIGIGLIVFALMPRKRVVPPPRPQGTVQTNYAAWVAYVQIILTQGLEIFGNLQKAIEKLFGPGGPFYHEPLPEYDAGSIFWDDVTNGVAGIQNRKK